MDKAQKTPLQQQNQQFEPDIVDELVDEACDLFDDFKSREEENESYDECDRFVQGYISAHVVRGLITDFLADEDRSMLIDNMLELLDNIESEIPPKSIGSTTIALNALFVLSLIELIIQLLRDRGYSDHIGDHEAFLKLMRKYKSANQTVIQ